MMTDSGRILLWLAALVGLLSCSVSTGIGGVISQLPGRDYLVVEGEDVDQFDDPFGLDSLLVVTADNPILSNIGSQVLPEDTNASGGAALYTSPEAAAFDVSALWKLQFARPGDYTLYYHYSLYEGDRMVDGYGNEDSIYLPLALNQAPEQAGRSDLGNQGHNNPLEQPPYWEGQFHWQQATLENGRPATYTVSDSDVGKVLDFSIATRERGSTIDLFLFHPDRSLARNLTEEELDAQFLGGGGDLVPLQAGDADQNLQFDQLDLVRVQTAAKYLSGQPATWGEGDWNGAPGGSPGNPPAGDGLFNQLDIVAAQQANVYLTGPYGAIQPDGRAGDRQAWVLGGSGDEVDLAPMPEPSTAVLMALGLLIGLARRVGKRS